MGLHLTRQQWGNVLVALGVAVWIAFLFVKLVVGAEPEVLHFLPFHLSGVIPGFALRRWDSIRRLLGQQRIDG